MADDLITQADLENAVLWWYENWLPYGDPDDTNKSCFFKVIERLLVKKELWRGHYNKDSLNDVFQELLSPDHCEPGVIEYSDVTEEDQTP